MGFETKEKKEMMDSGRLIVKKLIYNGWNPGVERITPDSGTTATVNYVWGKDLSGTLQGAGGVGGLLATQVGGAWYFPAYDANGNITQYVDEDGHVVASYTYDAFGNTVAQSGAMAGAFPFRFSTKYYDSESGLYYYGYRFYSPKLGRWLTRDPIEEAGGMNLYGFCGNNPIWAIDAVGCEWRITRNGRPYAEAEPLSSSDSFADLANILGLDVTDYYVWANTRETTPRKCKKYAIPNTIYYHNGKRKYSFEEWQNNILGMWKSTNKEYANKDRSMGFYVIESENVTRAMILQALKSNATYEYTFTGHGAGGAINTYPDGLEDVLPDRYTSYGIKRLTLQACQSANESIALLRSNRDHRYYKYNEWEYNVSTKGVFIGYKNKVKLFDELLNWRIAPGRNSSTAGIRE